MKIGVLATIIFGALIGYPIASFAGLAPDTDVDGVPDVLDNCSTVQNAGGLDCDTDQDGYGNACDCDFRTPYPGGAQNLGCTGADKNAWNIMFVAGTDMVADLNCSGSITGGDLNRWNLLFNQTNSPPTGVPFRFESGLSCAGATVGGCAN